MLLKGLVIPVVDYGDIVYGTASAQNRESLQVSVNKFARIILSAPPRTSCTVLCNELRMMTLKRRRQFHLSTQMYKVLNGFCPAYQECKFQYKQSGGQVTRAVSHKDLEILRSHLKITSRAFSIDGAINWNGLPTQTRICETVAQFRNSYLCVFGFI